MRSDFVVIRDVGFEDTAQMRLADHDEVIGEATATNGSMSGSAWPFCHGKRGAAG
jgi:hypothetical protein